jgi:hypothetical protein
MLLTVPRRRHSTEPATFSILSFWAFFRDYVFLYFVYRYMLIVVTLSVSLLVFVVYSKYHPLPIVLCPLFQTLWSLFLHLYL